MRIAILAAGLALTGCTATAEMQASEKARSDREVADLVEGRVAGEPQDCVSAQGTSGPRVIDASTLVYTAGTRTYLNRLETSCPGLSQFDTIIVEIHGSQVCRNDQFRALQPGTSIPGPYCRFAKFVPYTKPK